MSGCTGRPPEVASAYLLFIVAGAALIAWPQVPWSSATLWVTGAFVVGAAIGWLYERSGSLMPPIACHYLFNLLG